MSFSEAIVIDYISDITKIDQDTIAKISKKIIDPGSFLTNCPNGTIIAKPVSSTSSNQGRVYYPFFSHMIMPIKAGERVWIFDLGTGQVPYWLSRKVQNRSAEDLNFTHDDRARLYTSLKNKDASAREKNCLIFDDAGVSGVKLSTVRSESIARKDFIGEPVVSLASKSPDFTIQGSNGTIINLSTGESTSSATIEIVAGLATTLDQKQIPAQNAEGYFEILKPALSGTDPGAEISGLLSPEDDSRITVSRSFNPDSYYSLTGDDAGAQKSITIKTDGVRIIAKNDLKIVVGGSDDPASIIIKSDGNIILTPSSAGYLKLGGDDATAALLVSPDAVAVAGTVTGVPIVSTAGGILGLTGQTATGVFSSKILVKA